MKAKGVLTICFVLFFTGIVTRAQGQSFLPATSPQKVLSVDLLISSDSIYNLNYANLKGVTSFSLNGCISLKDKTGFARVVLIDADYNEYLISEYNYLLGDSNCKELRNYCEETLSLNSISVHALRIELANATVEIKDILVSFGGTTPQHELKRAQEDKLLEYKISLVKKQIRRNDLKWIAAETSIARLSYNEKKEMFGGRVPNLYGFEYYAGGIFEIPSDTPRAATASPYVPEFNWRKRHGKDWLSPVRNQKKCAACWAFAAIGTAEMLVNLWFNRQLNLDLSEQELLSCSKAGTCNGGSPGKGLDYIMNNGVVNESCFSYVAKEATCTGRKCASPQDVIYIGGRKSFNFESEDTIKSWVLQGPVILGITTWWHTLTMAGYKTIKAGDKIHIKNKGLDTVITIPAHNRLVGKTAWYIKNSWGTSWGDGGFGYVVTDFWNINPVEKLLGPVVSNNYDSDDIECTDNDGDGYYNWGIGPKPAYCPPCPAEPDGDDSNPDVGPMNQFGFYRMLLNDAIKADVDSVTGTGCLDAVINFENKYPNYAHSASWDFGEGATPSTSAGSSTQQVIYREPGDKYVTLTFADSNKFEYKFVRKITIRENCGVSKPYAGQIISVPGTVPVEKFNTGGNGVSYYDTDDTNIGGAYRLYSEVDIGVSSGASNGYFIGWTSPGEWTEYTIDVKETSLYDFGFEITTPYNGKSLYLNVDDKYYLITIPNTGEWYSWKNVSLAGVPLTQGIHTVRLIFRTGDVNIAGLRIDKSWWWIHTNLLGGAMSADNDINIHVPNEYNSYWNGYGYLSRPDDSEDSAVEQTPIIDLEKDVYAYPNPFIRELVVKLSHGHNYKIIKVFDMTGRLIDNIVLAEETEIRIGQRYKPGTYFVKLFSNDDVKEIIVIKQARH